MPLGFETKKEIVEEINELLGERLSPLTERALLRLTLEELRRMRQECRAEYPV